MSLGITSIAVYVPWILVSIWSGYALSAATNFIKTASKSGFEKKPRVLSVDSQLLLVRALIRASAARIAGILVLQ